MYINIWCVKNRLEKAENTCRVCLISPYEREISFSLFWIHECITRHRISRDGKVNGQKDWLLSSDVICCVKNCPISYLHTNLMRCSFFSFVVSMKSKAIIRFLCGWPFLYLLYQCLYVWMYTCANLLSIYLMKTCMHARV